MLLDVCETSCTNVMSRTINLRMSTVRYDFVPKFRVKDGGLKNFEQIVTNKTVAQNAIS